jgi:hypothetical protein
MPLSVVHIRHGSEENRLRYEGQDRDIIPPSRPPHTALPAHSVPLSRAQAQGLFGKNPPFRNVERRPPSLRPPCAPASVVIFSPRVLAQAIGRPRPGHRLAKAVWLGESGQGARVRGSHAEQPRSQARVTRRLFSKLLGPPRWDPSSQAPALSSSRRPGSHTAIAYIPPLPTRPVGIWGASAPPLPPPLSSSLPPDCAPLTDGYQTGKVAVLLVSTSLLVSPSARHARG